MAFVFHLEVDVSFQVIGEKTKAKLEGQKPNGIVEQVDLASGEKCAGFFEVAFEDGPCQIHIKENIIHVFRRFTGPVAGRPETIPDIVVNQARFDGVEVDQAHSLAGARVKKKII